MGEGGGLVVDPWWSRRGSRREMMKAEEREDAVAQHLSDKDYMVKGDKGK